MSFFTRYELVRLIPNTAAIDGDAKSFQAVERESRRPTLLHMVTPGLLAQRVKAVDKAPGVIEVGEFAGSVYLITEVAESFTGLSKWLDGLEAGRRSPSIAPAIAKAPVASEPMDRTKTVPIVVPQVSATPVDTVGQTSSFSAAIEQATKTSGLPQVPLGAASKPVLPTKSSAASSAAEDQFREMLEAHAPVVPVTRSPILSAPPASRAVPATPPVPQIEPQQPSQPQESDGFTAMFGVRGRGSAQQDSLAGVPLKDLKKSTSPEPTISSLLDLPEKLPGQGPAAGAARGNLARPSTPTADLSPKKEVSSEPGEFTRLMGGAPAAQEQGEFTRLMGGGPIQNTPSSDPLPTTVGREISALSAAPFPTDPRNKTDKNDGGDRAGNVDSVWLTPAQPPAAAKPAAVSPPPAPLINDDRAAAGSALGDGFTQEFFRKPAAHKGLSQEPSGSSEFTKFFGPGLKGGAMNVEEEVARHEGIEEPGARPFMKAGEFTRMFGQPGGPEDPKDAPPRRPLVRDDKGGVSRMFGLGELSPHPGTASTPEPEPTKPVIGEYTRIISAPNQAVEQVTPNAVFGAGVESPDDAKKRHHKWMLIGGGALIAILLIAVIALLLTRK